MSIVYRLQARRQSAPRAERPAFGYGRGGVVLVEEVILISVPTTVRALASIHVRLDAAIQGL